MGQEPYFKTALAYYDSMRLTLGTLPPPSLLGLSVGQGDGGRKAWPSSWSGSGLTPQPNTKEDSE